jgi:hypothetical protein
LLQPGKLQLPNVRTRRGVLLWCLAVGLAIELLGVLSAPATADDSGRLRLVQVLEDGKDGVEGVVRGGYVGGEPGRAKRLRRRLGVWEAG